MKPLDKLYQDTLNEEVKLLINCSAQKLKQLDDYGNKTIIIDNRKIEIGWWKYRVNDDTYHIVYKTFRKTFLILQKPFLQGVKVFKSEVQYMNNEELSHYD